MSEEIEAWRRVIRTVDVAGDLQVHVSALTVDGEDFLEIRNWIISDKSYGRGIVVPISQTRAIRDGLTELMKEHQR